MAKQTINIGAVANDRTGDALRTAFNKVNENFTELYNGAGGGTADLGDFKIEGSYLGTIVDGEPNSWGGTSINISPNGEGNSWLWLPNNSEAEGGGDTELGNYGDGGISLITSRGTLNLGGNMEGPGLPAHFHIAFSESNSIISSQDLFLGDDYNYLKVGANASGVTVGTNQRSEGSIQKIWNFNTDGSLQLPTDGTITNSDGNVLVSSSTFVDLPSWLTAVSGTNHLPTINADYGWDSNGVWFTNNTITDGEEGTSYPVRVTDSIPASYGVVITVDFDADPFSNDFGIGVWETGTDPVWYWGPSSGGNRIGAQYNGTTPELYGIVGTGVGGEGRWDLPATGTYRARLTISPPSGGSIAVTLETLDTSNNVLDTISYEEQAFSSSYTIGFAADQDNGTDKTYMKNLIVNINDGGTIYNDNLTTYNSVGSVGTGHFNFADNTVTVTSQDMNFVTTRGGFDIDCDFDVEAADDIWIRALGDQIGVMAANSIYFESNNLDMYPQVFYGGEEDFLGTWTGNELTISTVNGNTNLINLLTEYVSNARSIWIKTSAGYVETTNNDPALKTVGDTNTVFVIPTAATSPSSGIAVLRLKLYDSINSDRTSWYWEFRKDGTTTIPGKIDFPIKTVDLHNGGQQQGSTLQFTNPDYQAIITGPAPTENNNAQRLIIQGQRGVGTGEGGDVYLWAGDAPGTNGGDIKIYAGDADQSDAGYGGYINIDGGRGFTNGGNVSITGGNSPGGTGGNVSIMSGYGVTGADNGSVSIQVGGYYWQFNNTGSLVLPSGSDIKNSSGNSVINNGVASPTPTGDPVYPTAIDLTKTTNALADNAGSWYTLANGYEGQIMYLVPKNGTTNINTTINIANARVLDNSGSTTASVYTNIDFHPFSTINGDVPNVITMIFTDGAWQSSGGTWD